MTKEIQLSFGTFVVDGNIVIGTINEGVHFDEQQFAVWLVAVQKAMQGRPWVYVSNRRQSYSLDPTLHEYLGDHAEAIGLKGFVVVNYPNHVDQSSFEQLCLEGAYPYRVVDTLDAALAWARRQLSEA